MLFSTYHSRVDWRSRVRTIRNRVEMSKASPEFEQRSTSPALSLGRDVTLLGTHWPRSCEERG